MHARLNRVDVIHHVLHGCRPGEINITEEPSRKSIVISGV